LKKQVFRPNTVISPLQASEIMRVKMSGKSNCDCCMNYIYDEEEDYYECSINLDEDDMENF
jgi:hypothetical protein